ncbi:hypothetical protein ABI_12510 [Asticcacaulis biprosthecium C19]|uniref:Uncharacterized protein n=1 Tax=Asticcacaulis biprosthecium C19 TaxID=715226 RepID=F4QHS6_9CAUL|nr:hypothetical protein [Asticcacaulis biprosthecium]EGF92813.1 hypothetical protein ABI_12510 [Asticcacaulis biprosthecium C19]
MAQRVAHAQVFVDQRADAVFGYPGGQRLGAVVAAEVERPL